MTTPKKKKKWSPVGNKAGQYFSVQDVKNILSKAKVPLESKDESKLESIAERLELEADFYFSRKIHQDGPTIPEIRVALENVKKKAKELRLCLEDLDFRTKYEHLLFDVYEGIEFFDKIYSSIVRLENLAEDAYKKIPEGKVGPMKDSAQLNFAVKLFPIFRDITGVNHYPEITAPFIDFVFESMKHIKEPAQSKNALKQRIWRFIKDRNSKK